MIEFLSGLATGYAVAVLYPTTITALAAAVRSLLARLWARLKG